MAGVLLTDPPALTPDNPAGPLILALGDSLTAGYGLAPEQGFAVRLEALLQKRWPAAHVINAGVSGDTSAGAAARLPRLLSGLKRRPHLAIVELGANDVLRGIPPVQTGSNLDRIVAELGACGIAVLLATIDPPPFMEQFTRGYAGIHESVAAAHGSAIWPFFPPGVLGAPEMTLWDRVHPNARAIDLCARHMLPAVAEALSAATTVQSDIVPGGSL